MSVKLITPALLLISLIGQSLSRGADTTPDKPATAEAPAADAIPQLIKQLDANSFPERQQASQQLGALGKAAIPALTEAALGAGRETITRAIDVLKSQLKSNDEATQAAAKQALEKIAKDGKGPAAKQADLALNPKKDSPQENPGIQIRPGIQIGGGQVQIQFRVQANGGGANGKTITSKNVNGVKTIEATEKGRKVKIVDDPNKGIEIEVTETKDGKETTQKYEAKDRDELKKKHPEADKIYDEYAPQAAQVQIQAFPGLPGQAIPALPIAPNQNIPAAQRGEAIRLEVLNRQLEFMAKQLKQFGENSPAAEQISKAIQELEQARQTLKEAQAKLEKQN